MRLDEQVCNRRRMVRLGVGWAALSAGAALAQGPGTSASAPVSVGGAPQATPLAADPALEARVMEVAHELRCLVCQNETIAASHAELAVDLRKQIRLKLQQGQSQSEIIDFMVARYGDFVRYRPALKSTTVMLWVGPFVLLLASLAGLAFVIHRRRQVPAVALSDAQRAQAQALLNPPSPPTSS